jgi:hypothetical protein
VWFKITTNPGPTIHTDGQKNKNGNKSYKNCIYQFNKKKRNVPVKPLKSLTEPQGSTEHGSNTTNLQWHIFVFVKMLKSRYTSSMHLLNDSADNTVSLYNFADKMHVPSLQFSTLLTLLFLKLAKVAGTHNQK